jgi:hypothetical protein
MNATMTFPMSNVGYRYNADTVVADKNAALTDNDVRELSENELDVVSGAVSQSDVIGVNMGIIGIGAGAVFAGMTAPAWGPVALIGLSIAVTGAFVYEQL